MGLDLVELWNNMSIVVKIITTLMILMSVFMFYVITERLLTFRAASDQSIRYVQALGEYLRQHKVSDALSSARGASKRPVAKVMESGLTALLQGRGADDARPARRRGLRPRRLGEPRARTCQGTRDVEPPARPRVPRHDGVRDAVHRVARNRRRHSRYVPAAQRRQRDD